MISTRLITGRFFLLPGMLILLVWACKPADTTSDKKIETASTTEFLVQAEDFYESSEGVSLSSDGQTITSLPDAVDWAAYEVEISQTGRYQIEVQAVSTEGGEASFWLEDYIDNKDGRTYNITGSLRLLSEGNQTVSVDGSPLSAGKHKIKLHKKGAGVEVDAIQFKLLRAHQETPEVLTQNMEGEEWKLAWSDEFEGSGLPDTTKWTYDIGDWGWGNNELQYYTVAKSKNARQEDGNLIIESHKNDNGHAWSLARLTTRGKVAFKYGKIEFRAKVPPQRGNWAAGWTLGDTYRDEKSWPYCGEIDIMESVGYELNDETGEGKAHASVHCGAYYFKLGNQHTAQLPLENMVDEFHTYGVIWTPQKITAYVDDNPYLEYGDTKDSLTWPFDIPQNIILNLAMGGGWGGAQGMDENMTSQKLVIDYVRVYERQ